jgi:beta-lactamase superfamily II metal-dependent hydrolase
VQHFVEGGEPANSGVKAARALLAGEPAEHHIIFAKDVKKQSFMREWRNELMTGSEANIRFLSAGRMCNNINNASLVMRVEYKGRSFLLLGDAEESDKEGSNVGCGGLLFRIMDPAAAFPSLLNVDVYKVAHHGARNGTIALLMTKTKPAYVVISAGDNTRNQARGNFSAWDHGHPNTDAVDKLEARTQKTRVAKSVTVMAKQETLPLITRSMTKAIYSTGWDGDIVFSVDAAGVLSPPTLSP